MSRLSRLIAILSFLIVPGLLAQTGPWTDGELIVRSVDVTGGQVLYRVLPETGHGVPLISGFYWAGWAGSMVFDPYRNGLLTCMGLPPDNIFTEKLWLVAADGTATTIPGFTNIPLRAFAPVGDGRVYFQRHAGNPSWEIDYLDAADQSHLLMDATGLAPFSFSVEHLLYHAPTNSLLATNSGWWSPNDCVSGTSSIFRIPLSADGSQVAGPVTCVGLSVSNEIMSMDYLPGGNVLINVAGGQFYDDVLLQFDPSTLAVSSWATSTINDLNGGVWSARIGKAIILDDTNNLLRSYSFGESGLGTVIASDVIISPGTTGYSPTETLAEIDLNGPGCLGTGANLGPGVAGTGPVVPTLGVIGCPDVGNVFSLSIDNAVGGATGVLAAGYSLGSLPVLGGTLYVDPIAILVPLVMGGASGAPGAGSLAFPLLFTDPATVGLTLYLQAGFIDAGATYGISLSNGLLLSIG